MMTRYEKRLETTGGRSLGGYRCIVCVGGFAHSDGSRTCIVHGGVITAEDPFGGCDGPVNLR